MIIGIGNDIVDIRRIERAFARFGDRFARRCFTPTEIAKAHSRRAAGTEMEVYAKRFAAKEACAKALRTGFAKGVHMKDIGVVADPSGAPIIELSGGALSRLQELTPAGHNAYIHLSLSDEPPYSTAYVVVEARPK